MGFGKFLKKASKKLGGGNSETFNSTSIQKVYNESIVKMAQNCDTTIGNTLTIIITGDNNIISDLWVSQDIDWTVDCVADFFNNREYQTTLSSDMEGLAKRADKAIGLPLGLEFPIPTFATTTKVNTTQIQETTNRLFASFSQDCDLIATNNFEITVDGDFNTATNIAVDQMIDGMTDCLFNAQNQEKVVTDLQTTVTGESDIGSNIWTWVLLGVVILVVIIVFIVILKAIFGRGGDKKDKDKNKEMEGYDEEDPYAMQGGDPYAMQGMGGDPYAMQGMGGDPYAMQGAPY